MTVDKGFKRVVRSRARRTGESYVAARRALLGTEGGSQMGTSASAAKLYGLSDLLLTDEQIPDGFELNRDWSGPINRHYEGPTFEAPGFVRDDPGAEVVMLDDNIGASGDVSNNTVYVRFEHVAAVAIEPPKAWTVPTRSMEAKVKPFLIELGLQGGYGRAWRERDLAPNTGGESISNRILELRDAEAAKRYITNGRDDDTATFMPEFVERDTYRDAVTPIGDLATVIGVDFCVSHLVCSLMIMMRDRDEAFAVARRLVGPYAKFVHEADPANRLQ